MEVQVSACNGIRAIEHYKCQCRNYILLKHTVYNKDMKYILQPATNCGLLQSEVNLEPFLRK